jgi:hypothetical protein
MREWAAPHLDFTDVDYALEILVLSVSKSVPREKGQDLAWTRDAHYIAGPL